MQLADLDSHPTSGMVSALPVGFLADRLGLNIYVP
jgi:hypothetical protein